MKNVKRNRFLTTLLILSLFLPLFANVQTAEAKTVTIAASAQKIALNGTCTIIVQNKAKGASYSYASSDAKIASVSKSGKVTGKGYGSAQITVTQNKGSTSKKIGTVKITVEKCVLDAAVKKGICAFFREDGSAVFAGGKGGKPVKSLAQIEGLLTYQNPNAVYQYVLDNKNLLDINEKGKLVAVKESGTAKITVRETYGGKTRKVGTFRLQVEPDRKIIAYLFEEAESGSIWVGDTCRYVYDIQGREISCMYYREGAKESVYEKEYDSHGNLAVERERMSSSDTDIVKETRYRYTYEDDRPVSLKVYSYISYTYIDSDESRAFYEAEELQDVFTCTVDEKGRITVLEGKYGSKSFTYDENGNCTLIREWDDASNNGWDTEIAYTDDGQVAEKKEIHWAKYSDQEDITTFSELVEQYHFDSSGYAVSCEYSYQSEGEEESQHVIYPVKGMDLSEYFARLRADQTRDYDPSAIVGRWKFVLGVDNSQPALGVLEFFADGRVVAYDYDVWEEPNAEGEYSPESEGEEMRYRINGGELTFYEKDGDNFIRGHYLLTGDTLFYLVNDFG